MNDVVSDKGVCRTVPARPGSVKNLLISTYIHNTFFFVIVSIKKYSQPECSRGCSTNTFIIH